MCQRISIFAQNWFCFHTTNCLHSFMCWWWLWNIEWNEIWQANLAEQKIARRKCSSSVELRVGCRQWVGIFYHSWWHTIHILNFAHCSNLLFWLLLMIFHGQKWCQLKSSTRLYFRLYVVSNYELQWCVGQFVNFDRPLCSLL